MYLIQDFGKMKIYILVGFDVSCIYFPIIKRRWLIMLWGQLSPMAAIRWDIIRQEILGSKSRSNRVNIS